MTSSVAWNPVLPLVPLFVAGMVLLALLFYIEWRRRQRFRTLRMLCQLLIVSSLLGLFTRPSFKQEATVHPVVVLTPGFNQADIDSLTALHPNLSVVSTHDSIAKGRIAQTVSLRNLNSLGADPLWIAGVGLPAYALPSIPTGFHFLPPATMPEGIVALSFRIPVTTAARNAITGTYRLQAPATRVIRLSGPGGIEDSTLVKGPGESPFALEFIPPVAGGITYKLEETDTLGKILEVSTLPVYVERSRNLNVLIITDHPSFEVRYLKNYLADRGHRIALRSRVSRDRFHQEFANQPRESLNSLTATRLAKADLLLLDHATYLSMGVAERERIHQSVDEGLGLIFIAPVATTKGLLPFKQVSTPDTARVSAGKARFVLPVPGMAPVGEITSVVSSDDGRTVAGCRCTGVKVGFQLLTETYQLGLQNKTAFYAALWTPLIDKVSRTRQTGFNISLQPQFPVFTDEPTDVRVISAFGIPSLSYDSMSLPLIEDMRIDDIWHGRLWAGGGRWHTLMADSTSLHFHDLPETEWKALRAARQFYANRIWAANKGSAQPAESRRPVTLLFFILFMVASGLLWAIPKI